LSAVYSGDTNYLTSTSATLYYVGLSPLGAPTSVTATDENGNVLVSWTAPASTGGFTLLGYTVTASPGGQTCTVAGSSTSCTVPSLAVGTGVTFSVTATTSGGAGPSSSGSSAVTPSLAASSVSLGASPASTQTVGASVRLTAVVTTGATGTVSFDLGGVPISGCANEPVDSGLATCATTALVAGTISLTAVYSGDTNYASSTSSTLTYTMSSTTLAPPSVFLVINSATAVAYNQSLTLTTSGGSGAGAVTYAVTNGTATGCTISGATLSASSSGTCLAVATQAADGTHLAQSSNVTTVNFYWYYVGTFGVISYSYAYTCPSGGTLSGTTCTVTTTYTAAGTPTCPYGGNLSGTTCTLLGYYAAHLQVCNTSFSQWSGECVHWDSSANSKAPYCPGGGNYLNAIDGVGCYAVQGDANIYSCPSGGTLSGTQCVVASTYAAVDTYSCPSGGTLSGTTCTVTSTYAASYGVSSYNYGYECPNGGSASGATCSITGGSGPNLRHALLSAATGGTSTAPFTKVDVSPRGSRLEDGAAITQNSSQSARRDHLVGHR
jgi:conjugal transfer mating pair stabilization protein TraN